MPDLNSQNISENETIYLPTINKVDVGKLSSVNTDELEKSRFKTVIDVKKCDANGPLAKNHPKGPEDHKILPSHSKAAPELASKKAPIARPPPMTLLRKIAFVLSFIPSFLFIASISIIFPCETEHDAEINVHNVWTIKLHSAEAVSYLKFSGDFIVGDSYQNSSALMRINQKNGTFVWKIKTNSTIRYLKCHGFDFNSDGVEDCLMQDHFGNLHVFNASNGQIFWEENISQLREMISFPIILPKCYQDRCYDAIALAIENKIKIFAYDKDPNSIRLPNCQSLPSSLKSWSQTNTTVLLFGCKFSDSKGSLIKLSQKFCCENSTETTEISHLLERKHSQYANNYDKKRFRHMGGQRNLSLQARWFKDMETWNTFSSFRKALFKICKI